MAGPARKDVELVIRARDQATKAFDAIAKAAGSLTSEQDDLVKSGAGVDNTLGRLGNALSKLNTIIKGVSLGDDLSKQMERAKAESDRLQKSMRDTASESERLARELDRASQSTAELNARTTAAAAAVAKAGDAAKQARADQKALNRDLAESIAARDKLVKAEARLTTTLEQQPAKVEKARERLARLSKELEGMVEPTATFQERFEASVRSLAKAEGRLAGLQNELEQTRTSIVSANVGIGTLTGQLEKAEASVTETAAKLKAVNVEYKELGAAAKASASEQRSLVRAQEDIVEALAAAEGRAEKSGAAMIELAAEQDKARAAMADLATEARGPLLKAFSQQQSAISRINNAYQANRTELAALNAAMKDAGLNTTGAMISGYNRLLTASKEISTEFFEQRAALAALKAALKEGVTDVDQLNAVYARFSQTLSGSAAALTRVEGIQQRGAQVNRELADASDRAAVASQRDGNARRQLASTSNAASTATDKLANAVRHFYGESRTAMSFTQRLRGEILSLIAAYGGFYGVINVLGQVVDAYSSLEAATSRLNVVTGGDENETAQELDFIRRMAERLGIEFSGLSEQYSKFAVATQGTNLEGDKTRKIFTAVAEAARVNKVSMDEMAGTFTALTQIVSKGKVQLEELTGQLGDRLPGALQIMADGLGVTTEELLELTKEGKVSSDALVGFAEELTRRFGPQLGDSLETVTANMGFLQTSVTAALLAFGEAGFMESFNLLLIQLNDTLRSSDFQAFIGRISQGVSQLVNLLSFLVSNFRAVAVAMTAIIGIRLLPVFTGLVSAFMAATFNARMTYASFIAVQGGMASMIPVAAATTGAVGRLGLAMKALTSSTGIGLLLTAAAAAFTLWGTGADKASDAMERHRKIVDGLKNAYDSAGGSVQGWAEKIDGVTSTEVRLALEAANAARDESFRALRSALVQGNPLNVVDQVFNIVDAEARTQSDSLNLLISDFEEGTLKVDDFKKAVSDIAETAKNDLIKQMAQAILDGADAAGEFTDKADEMEAAQRVLNKTATEADFILLGLRDAVDAVSASFNAENLESFTDAMREMAGFIPELKAELDTLKDLDAIDAAYESAIRDANLSPDRNLLTAAANQQRDAARTAVLSAQDEKIFKEIAENTGVTQSMFQSIFGEEGKRLNAYDDGYGTQTIGYGNTQINGRAVRAGDTITETQAIEMAVAEIAKLVAFIEGSVDVPLSPKQMEALVSYAYNAGQGSLERDGILDALREGSYSGAEAAIRNGVDTSKGEFVPGLRARREREANTFAEGSQDPAIIEQLAEVEAERLQTATEFREQLQLNAEQEQFLIDIAKKDIIERETLKALREAELAAKEAGVALTAQEIEGIKSRTAAQFAEQAQTEAENKVKKDREEVETRVNDLLALRGELEAQLELYREQGAVEKTQETESAIAAVNVQLLEAIANAKAMWEAVGGEASTLAIAKLQSAELEAQKFANSGKKAQYDWSQVGTIFANGLTNAFTGFAEAVANGTSIGEAARDAFLKFASDFLIQIGQMILQQTILNALRGALGGTSFGNAIGITPLGHTGGIVGTNRIGSGNMTRSINPAVFNSAPRYHTGGVVGLKPGEVPAILKANEEVLTRDDPRHAYNGGAAPVGGSASPVNLKIINSFDPADAFAQGADTKVGEEALLNVVQANSSKFRAALGV